jgi:predicted ATPase
MLTKLNIRNFKAWRDTGEIRLAPITVFFGTNSSGKSSLLQLLLMLKQTAESPDRRRVLHPGDFNTPVELGTYRDLVFEHDIGNRISFRLEWTLPDALRVGDPLSQTTFRGDRILFEVEIAAEPKNAEPYVQSLRVEICSR